MSGDGGETWKLIIEELIDQQNPTIAGFHWHTASHGFIYQFGQWIETTDGGLTWGAPNKLGLWANRIYPLCSFDDGSVLLSSYYWNENTITTYISEDGNPNKQKNLAFHDYWMEQATFTGKYIIGGNDGWLDDYVEISADSGKTWTAINPGLENEIFFDGPISIGQNTVVLCGDNLSTIKTVDGGQTWTAGIFANGRGSSSMYCKNKNECFLLGSTGRLLKTDDAWETWKAIDLNAQVAPEDRNPNPHCRPYTL